MAKNKNKGSGGGRSVLPVEPIMQGSKDSLPVEKIIDGKV